MLCSDCFQEKGERLVCSHCGFDESLETDARRLPLRITLKKGRYLVGKILGRGGFGLTYKAFDNEQYRAIVVIKECLLTDSGQVTRADDKRKLVINSGFKVTYEKWLDRFCEEAKRIALFQHPNIVRIVDLFKENNTAYYVMPLVEGVDMRVHLEHCGGKLTEQELLPIAQSLISALCVLHGEGIIHRDIKPQNIILTKVAMEPVLIDFGAARDKFSKAESLSQLGIQTEGYSPIEQVTASSNQGPWTDLYSLSATFYRCLVGKPPIPSDNRFRYNNEDLYLPIEKVVPNISVDFARLINKGLTYSHKRRLQSADEMLKLLPVIPGSEDIGTKMPSWNSPSLELEIDTGDKYKGKPPRYGWKRGMVLLWFAPSILGFLGVIAADSPVNLVGVFLALLAINVIAWGLVAVRSRIQAEPAITFKTSYDGSIASDSKAIGTVRFLDGEMAGRTFSLSKGQSLLVGRSRSVDVTIRDQHLSKQHAKITFLNPDFEILDLGSTNGTYYVNYSDANHRANVKRIERYVGYGVFCLGPYEKERMRFECSARG